MIQRGMTIMPMWLTVIFQVLFFVVIFLVVYNQLKKYVLSKLHPNKWLILTLAVIAFFVPTMIAAYFQYNLNGTVWQYVQSAIFIVFFLWFVDLRSGAIYNTNNKRTANKKNSIVIKPKAKPNRVKGKLDKK
jgi:phosphatidylglycerophosphate synthase